MIVILKTSHVFVSNNFSLFYTSVIHFKKDFWISDVVMFGIHCPGGENSGIAF